jgi:hypothetical protein
MTAARPRSLFRFGLRPPLHKLRGRNYTTRQDTTRKHPGRRRGCSGRSRDIEHCGLPMACGGSPFSGPS